jgi:hypothetical protein
MESIIIGFPVSESVRRSRDEAKVNCEEGVAAFGRLLWTLLIGETPGEDFIVPRGPYTNVIGRCLSEEIEKRPRGTELSELLKATPFKRVVGTEHVVTFKEYVESFQDQLEKWNA